MSQNRSDVWKHFVDKNETTAKCAVCDAIIRHHGNTTNLREHLNRRHSTVYQPGASTSTGSPSVSSFFPKKIDPSGAKAKAITEHIVNVCVKDLRPFNIVKDAGFRDLIKHAWPTYQIPKRETIRELIMLRHTNGIKTLKSDLEKVNIDSDVSITTDGWTSITQDSYYTITGKSETEILINVCFPCPCNFVVKTPKHSLLHHHLFAPLIIYSYFVQCTFFVDGK